MRRQLADTEVTAAIEAALATAAWVPRALKDGHHLTDRLPGERGHARRAAAVCLARPGFEEHTEELRLALSGAGGWPAVELAALFTVLAERGFAYGDEDWLALALKPAAALGDEGRMMLWEPLRPLIEALAGSGCGILRGPGWRRSSRGGGR
ncbi:hypothetical protein MF672_017795 [Actinomadura sp. ATCC 31491]|uniref:Uncharacterized protein n=1 Tax=Actinomadura luzonensis TaxID=2805427 RepID=A0ABT0FTG6_9ACTN|nr:hypothetical protein [Actinomadura luzonensis]MCK2215627.1 hypothetical protein [Actinomadura luzonensis]